MQIVIYSKERIRESENWQKASRGKCAGWQEELRAWQLRNSGECKEEEASVVT